MNCASSTGTTKKDPRGGKRAGAGRPPGTSRGRNGRTRPVLTKTTVAQATYDGIKAEGRPVGRVIDDAWQCYTAHKTLSANNLK